MSKEPTQFQFDCNVSLLALRDYFSKVGYEEWREDMGWTEDLNFVDSWVEEKWSEFKKSPFFWFVNIDNDTQWKFLASIEKRVR